LNYGGWVNIPVPGYAGMTGSGGENTPAKKYVQAYSNVDWETRTRKSYSMLSKLFRRF